MEIKYSHISDYQKNAKISEDNKTYKLLNSYLDGAVALTEGKAKADAKEAIGTYHKQTDMKSFKDSADALKIIAEKEKDLKNKASSFGLREKVNYASDADVVRLSEVVSMGMASVASSLLAPIVATDPNALSATVLTATAAYATTKILKSVGGQISMSKTPDQQAKAKEYAAVKHAQLALKLLKKEIEAPLKEAKKTEYKKKVAELFAAGYGQPSGGMVHSPMVPEPSSAMPAGKEQVQQDNKSYWQEVKEVFATYGNPSGGMVHKDVPVKNEAGVGVAKQPQPQQDNKSYWQEVKEVFATYGNPSGGMVHKDVPVKNEAGVGVAKQPQPQQDKKSSYKEEVGKLYAAFGNPSGGMVHHDLPEKKEEVGKKTVTAAVIRRAQKGR